MGHLFANAEISIYVDFVGFSHPSFADVQKCKDAAVLAPNVHLFQDNVYRHIDNKPCAHCRRLADAPISAYEQYAAARGEYLLYNKFGELEHVYPRGIGKPVWPNTQVAFEQFSDEVASLADRTQENKRLVYLEEYDTVPGGFRFDESYGMEKPFSSHHRSACEAVCNRMAGCSGFEIRSSDLDQNMFDCTFKATPAHVLRSDADTSGVYSGSTLYIRRTKVESVRTDTNLNAVPVNSVHTNLLERTLPLFGIACSMLILLWYTVGQKVARRRQDPLDDESPEGGILLLTDDAYIE